MKIGLAAAVAAAALATSGCTPSGEPSANSTPTETQQQVTASPTPTPTQSEALHLLLEAVDTCAEETLLESDGQSIYVTMNRFVTDQELAAKLRDGDESFRTPAEFACVTSGIDMPDRIIRAIDATYGEHGLNSDEWGDFRIQWQWDQAEVGITIFVEG